MSDGSVVTGDISSSDADEVARKDAERRDWALDTGETFNIPSSLEEHRSVSVTPTETSPDSNPQVVN